MSFTSGTATTLQELFDAMETHLVTTVGWALAETIGAADKVFTSDGIGGGKKLTFRVTGGRGSVVEDPSRPENWAEHIIVRGYHKWNVGAPGTGVNEFGQWGPHILIGGTNGNDSAMYRTKLHPNETFNIWQRTVLSNYGQYMNSGRRLRYNEAGNNGATVWNVVDDIHDSAWSPQIGSPVHDNSQVVARDKTNDTHYVYHMHNVGLGSNPWRRRNLQTNVTEEMADPTANVSLKPMIFDGDDTIYAFQNGSVNFYKYTISTDTWSTLTNSPTTNDDYTDAQKKLIYVPNSVGGWLDGGAAATDVILIMLNNTGSLIYRYNINDDTWGATIASPFAMAAADKIAWDGKQFAYMHDGSGANNIWEVDLTIGAAIVGGSWSKQVAATNHPFSPSTTESMSVWANHPCRVPTLDNGVDPFEYFIFADLDTCTVAVKIPALFTGNTDHYYWMNFGAGDTLIRTEVMTTTDTASAGQFEQIEVDDTSAYNVGEKVISIDPATGAVVAMTIFTIDSATLFTVVDLPSSLPIGAIIGSDPDPKYVAGDSGMAIWSTDVDGFEGQGMAAGYMLRPLAESALFNLAAFSGGNGRGVQVPTPLQAFGRQRNGANTNEIRGLLKGILWMPSVAYPGPQDEEIIKIAGVDHKVFEEYARVGFRGPATGSDTLVKFVMPAG